MTTRPTRSALYIPGSKPRALDKARGLPCDAILFDLEDAVAPDAKVGARGTLAEALEEGGYGARLRLVRINGFDTDWGRDDAATFARAPCDGLLIPKVDGPADLDAVAEVAPDLALWAMIETPLGVLNAQTICAHRRLEGIVMGTNDLAKDLTAWGRGGLRTALQHSLLAARAAGIVAIDGVYNAYTDEDGLRAECEDGRDTGFDGKSLIHPAQIAVANAAFGPTEEEITLARRQIEAFDAAVADGQGVAVLDGRIVENLHIVTARATLAKAQAIAELERS
ncbi:CoA ester lyase [Salipiger sp. IMCC34102]|uniref:HpcH/HpaI aldolase/citrate lyase family protein n=1 Tax=Salipiger sp. IMCC34102 TaxID=2510647 RepID=UPI00101B9F72|nr:CoA ester lyase [Salipiger sp. IMCC34102]RYH04552.1 CoA ester lyase [Salipiger sp. IMCC34102]